MNDCKPIDIYCLDYIFNDKATPLRTFICINFGKTDGQGKRVFDGGDLDDLQVIEREGTKRRD